MPRILVYDNGGRTADRYTVIIGTSVYHMSADATSIMGVNQYAGELTAYERRGLNRFGKRITNIKKLPSSVRMAMRQRDSRLDEMPYTHSKIELGGKD
jgi:hypothetical protein